MTEDTQFVGPKSKERITALQLFANATADVTMEAIGLAKRSCIFTIPSKCFLFFLHCCSFKTELWLVGLASKAWYETVISGYPFLDSDF